MLSQIFSHKWHSLMVLIVGLFTGVMLQRNWLFLMRDGDFEKHTALRYFIASPIIALMIFGIWVFFLYIIRPAFSSSDFDHIIYKDSWSILPLTLTIQVFWNPPLTADLWLIIFAIWVILKIIIYPDGCKLILISFKNYLFQPLPLKISNKFEGDYLIITFQGAFTPSTLLFAIDNIHSLLENNTISKITLDFDGVFHNPQVDIFINLVKKEADKKEFSIKIINLI